MSLSQAIIAADANLLNQALDNPDYKKQLNELDEFGYYPLVQCAIMDNLAFAELLLAHGADVNVQAQSGTTALYWAVENNNRELVKLLLHNGADPNIYANAGDAPLVTAMMRKYLDVKNMLIEHGADLDFAYDYINTKLLGHRYELQGRIDLVDAQGRFTEVDLEGFVLQFSMLAVRNSLAEYMKNYMFQRQDEYMRYFRQVLDALQISCELLVYQQYNTNLPAVKDKIFNLLAQNELLIIPVAHAGHASALVFFADHVIVVDRRQDAFVVGSVGIYTIGNKSNLTAELIFHLLYTKKPRDFMATDFYKLLGLELVGKILMPSQITGNCSWANIEAAIPAALYLLYQDHGIECGGPSLVSYQDLPLRQYHAWQQWDLARELKFCMDSFALADVKRGAAKASILAAILFQRLAADREEDLVLAKRIIKLLDRPEYGYIFASYKEAYLNLSRTQAGENLKSLLEFAHEEEF